MMQAAGTLASCSSQVNAVLCVVNARAVFHNLTFQPICVKTSQRRLLNFSAQAQPTGKSEQYVDYAGKKSVFPAEACEETGENCDAEGVFKEVQPSASTPNPTSEPQPGPDREYQEYTGEKTVFPGEACEELGGDFCDPKFQEGVFPEKVQSSAN